MKRFGLGLLAVGLLVGSLAIPAMGGSGEEDQIPDGWDCSTFHRHGGFIPGSYDAAVLIESGFDTLIVYTNGQNLQIDPPEGRSSWDTIHKCQLPATTTTTVVESTTTTTEPATTTTTDPVTTTTLPETTTTTHPETTTSTTTPSTTTTSPGSTTTTTPSSTSTTVVVTTTESPPPSTSTSSVPVTTDPVDTTTAETLPFTGVDENLGLIALSLVGTGLLGLVFARRFNDEEG